MNREHCLFGSDRCVAVTPSDTAPALVALDAEMVIVNDDGERVVKAEKYFIGPGVDITQMTVLAGGGHPQGNTVTCSLGGLKLLL